jgi:hypothetical protein
VSSLPFYRVRGGAGRPGLGGEQAAVVVHHNGIRWSFQKRIGRGVWWGVMRSRCSDRYGERRQRREAACVHVRWRRRRSARGRRRPGGARTSAREERERPGGPTDGHWAGWTVGRRGGEGRWAVIGSKTGDGPNFKRNFFSNFN